MNKQGLTTLSALSPQLIYEIIFLNYCIVRMQSNINKMIDPTWLAWLLSFGMLIEVNSE